MEAWNGGVGFGWKLTDAMEHPLNALPLSWHGQRAVTLALSFTKPPGSLRSIRTNPIVATLVAY